MGLGALIVVVCAAHFILAIAGFVYIRIRHW